MHLLASQMPPGDVSYLPVVLMIIIAIGFAVTNIAASLVIGPQRNGDVKSSTYESGMVPFGDTRKRFNVRFYIVAMIFLVIDVETVFLYPFASIFAQFVRSKVAAFPGANFTAASEMLISMTIFVIILLLAYVYAWGKGVFRWD